MKNIKIDKKINLKQRIKMKKVFCNNYEIGDVLVYKNLNGSVTTVTIKESLKKESGKFVAEVGSMGVKCI